MVLKLEICEFVSQYKESTPPASRTRLYTSIPTWPERNDDTRGDMSHACHDIAVNEHSPDKRMIFNRTRMNGTTEINISNSVNRSKSSACLADKREISSMFPFVLAFVFLRG